MLRAYYLFLVVLLQSRISDANVRFVCPRPISPKSDQESRSCSPDVVSSHDSKDITDLDPGLFTVRFEETKFQPGSPFRISLVDNAFEGETIFGNDTNATTIEDISYRPSCLLLDHIPHNNHAVITPECSKTANDYPLGQCNGSTYYITVRIPDISCNDCILMLQQVIVKPDHEVCDLTPWDEADNTTDCTIYTSCARVRIRSSAVGTERDFGQCSDYLRNLPGDWPYRPQDIYETDHGATLTFDLLHKNLHIEIPDDLQLGPVERLEIRENLSMVWNATVSDSDKDGDTVKVTWENLSADDMDLLRDEELVLNVVGSEKSFAADIVYTDQHFSEGKLSHLHDLYSDSGWLVADNFLGPQAQDPVAALPAGPCAPDANYYMAFLQSVHVTSHGIVAMVVLEGRAYITVVLHVDHEVVQTITIKGPALVDIPVIELSIPPTFSGVFQAALDIRKQASYINTVQFLKLVEVKTDKEDAVLVGDLEEGMYTVLRDEVGHIHGLGAFQFLQGQWFRGEIVLNDLSPSIQSAWLLGPGDSKLVDLSRETVHCTADFCCLEALITEVSSELLLHMMAGQVTLYVSTEKANVSGKVMGSPSRYCQMMDGACRQDFNQFSMSGLGVEKRRHDQNIAEIPSWTEAEAYVLDRANVLHYCVLVGNLNMTGKSLSVGLISTGNRLDRVPFQSLPDYSNSYMACNHIPFENNPGFIASLSGNSHKWVNVVINHDSNRFLSQNLPIIFRGECIHSKIHVVGKDKSYWSHASAVLQDIYAVVSDHLKFIFDKNTTLYLMANKEDFEECNFRTAKQMVALDTLGDKGFYIYTITNAGDLYFADVDTCNSSSPLKLAVNVVEGVNVVQDNSHDEWCSKSVYSMWRDKQLKKWDEPEVSGPILIGLVVGLSSAGAFLLWQGIRLRRIPDSFRGNSDNVFIRF